VAGCRGIETPFFLTPCHPDTSIPITLVAAFDNLRWQVFDKWTTGGRSSH
jgi:hypothetical protein